MIKSKKLFSTLFISFLSVSLLTGCNFGAPKHVHNYYDAFDKEYHWKQCACGDIIDKEAHVTNDTFKYPDPNEYWSDEVTASRVCTVCNYKYDELRLQFPEQWQHDENGHYKNSITKGYENVVVRHNHSYESEWKEDEDHEGQHRDCPICGYQIHRSLDEKSLQYLDFELNEDGQSYAVFEKDTDYHVDGALKIPATYNSLSVTKIKEEGFTSKGGSWVNKLIIPNTIKEIGDRAFVRHSLNEIVFDNFKENDRIERIGKQAFAETLVWKLDFPNVDLIDEEAFSSCSRLRQADLSKVSHLGLRSFAYSGLIKVTFGANTIIDSAAFIGESEIIMIDKPEGFTYEVDKLFNIKSKYYYADKKFVEGDYLYVQFYDTHEDTGVIIHTITDTVLAGYLGVLKRDFKLPTYTDSGYNITEIGDNAFSNMRDDFYLVHDNIYDGFALEIPKYVKKIGDSAFYRCPVNKLTFQTAGNIKLEIGDNAFGSTWLEELALPDTVAKLGYGAFQDSNLRKISFDSSIEMGPCVFQNCDHLEGTEYENCFYLGNAKKPYLYLLRCKNTDVQTVTIHEQCLFIGHDAFINSKISSLTLLDGLKFIDAMAFCACDNLTSITIPHSVTHFDDTAFHNCSKVSPLEVTYEGTKEEFANITHHSVWGYEGFTVVHCTDGDIDVSQPND